MNRRAAYIIVAAFLCCESVSAQNGEDAAFTKGWPNGKFWQRLDRQGKNTCLVALETGINLFANEMMKETSEQEFWDRIDARRNTLLVPGIGPDVLIQEIDRFFVNPKSIPIPVAYAYGYSLRKISGETPDMLNLYVESLQKDWSK